MGIRPTFTRADVHAALVQRAKAIEAAIINTLAYLGEQCVNQARSVNSYRDQTGNLRNSVGYVIVKDGTVIRTNFQRTASVVATSASGHSRTTSGSSDGVKVGEELARQLAESVSGYALIVVAGMNYAMSVESRGQDVLSSAEHYAEAQLPGLLRDLKIDIATLR